MSTPVFVSHRADGRGHYPAGRRRTTLTASQQRRTRRYLKRILRLGYSLRKVAKVIGRHPTVVAKWLSGKCWPTPESEARLRGFIRAARKAGISPRAKRRTVRYSKAQREKYVAQIGRLRQQGQSFARITRTLAGPSERTVHRWRSAEKLI